MLGWSLAQPRASLVVVLAGCALYLGIYLRYRASVGGTPISGLDFFIVFILAAAWSLRPRPGTSVVSGAGGPALVLLTLGLILGCLIGLANHAGLYPFAQVARVEAELTLALFAALVAGQSLIWQRGLVSGLYAAAAIAASLQILSFLYQTGFHRPLWSSFAFGASNVAALTGTLTSATVAGTRDNYLATFVMLPGLALALYRLRRADIVLLVAITIATAVSLSRSMWFAAALTAALALAARHASGRRLHARTTIGLFAGVALAVVILGTLYGGILSDRLAGSFSTTDVSLVKRQSETDQALSQLTASPLTLALGVGAGTFVPSTHLTSDSAILEDQLLAIWTNFGVVAVLGTVGLLLLGGYRAFGALRSREPYVNQELMALGLSLPAVLAVSIFSGTLLELNVSLPFWLLAGTILANADSRPARQSASAVQRAMPSARATGDRHVADRHRRAGRGSGIDTHAMDALKTVSRDCEPR
jgi:hypothetical protein